MVRNLARAKKVCIRMSRILSREGTAPRVSGFFFKAVIQAVLTFGADTWVVTPHMRKSLGGFKIQVAIWLTGKLPRKRTDEKWIYTSKAAAREETRFLRMEEYVNQCQNTVVKYITT